MSDYRNDSRFSRPNPKASQQPHTFVTGYPEDSDFMPYHGQSIRTTATRPWWNPRYWARKVWLIIVAIIIIIIIIAVAVGVTVSKNNAYPLYKELSYSLADTCKYLNFHPITAIPADQLRFGDKFLQRIQLLS